MRSEAYTGEDRGQGPVALPDGGSEGPAGHGRQPGAVVRSTPSLVGAVAAYVAGRALGPGAHYLAVFRFAGAARPSSAIRWPSLQNSIWYRRKWSTTLKSMFDGLVYALVTAGLFGWPWPS